MRRVIVAFLFLVIFLLPHDAIAGWSKKIRVFTGPFSGKVVDAETGEPVGEAFVLVSITKHVTAGFLGVIGYDPVVYVDVVVTDKNGNYFTKMTEDGKVKHETSVDMREFLVYKPGYIVAYEHERNTWDKNEAKRHNAKTNIREEGRIIKLEKIPPGYYDFEKNKDRLKDVTWSTWSAYGPDFESERVRVVMDSFYDSMEWEKWRVELKPHFGKEKPRLVEEYPPYKITEKLPDVDGAIKKLKKSSGTEKILLVNMLGRWHPDFDVRKRAVDALIAVLAEENKVHFDNIIKQEAVISLRYIYAWHYAAKIASRISVENKKIIDALRKAKIDVYLRFEAVSALVEMRCENTIEDMLEAANDKSADVRRLAPLGIRWTATDCGKIPGISGVFNNKDNPVRKNVIVTLSRLADDSDANVRADTAKAIAAIEAYDLIPTLNKLIVDRDDNVKSKASNALASFKSEDSIQALAEYFYLDETTSKSFLSVAEATGEKVTLKNGTVLIRNKKAADALFSVIERKKLEMGHWAIFTAGRFDDPRVFDVSLRVLKSEELSGDIYGAINNVLNFDRPEVIVPVLITLLSAKGHYAHTSIIEALGKIGGPDAVKVLIKALKSENKEAAARALRKHKTPDVADALLDAYTKQVNPDVACYFSDYRYEKALQVLLDFVRGYEGTGSLECALKGIELIGDASVIPILNELAKDQSKPKFFREKVARSAILIDNKNKGK